MADNTLYYDTNLLRYITDTTNWTYTGQSPMVVDNKMRLEPNTKAYVDLSSDYISSAMLSSKKRKIVIETVDADSVVSDMSAYSCSAYTSQNNIGSLSIDITFLYRNDNTSINRRITLTCNNVSGKIDSTTHKGTYVFEIDMDILSIAQCTFTIRNNGSNNIYITKAQMFRSKDIDQLAENIVTNLTMVNVKFFDDGMSVGFDSAAEPIKLWWLDDGAGHQSGINVNNQKIVSIEFINELLT